MPSERVQRQIDGLLDEAEAAIKASDWALVRDRARNVLALDPENRDALDYLAAADRWLAEPVHGADAPPVIARGGRPDSEGSTPLPTTFVGGRYTVVRFLGEGGKKRVYLAHDTRLDRDVAFALIKTEGLDAEGRERIEREAQAMGRLGTHPHIVSVFDMGEEDGQPYLVTELMGGGDVEGLLEGAEDHRLPIERAVEIAQQVCRGLEFAHSHGLVHRDLKPGNVWLTADGSAKIGDFGLAVALDRSRLTQAGMMVGTVAYMPPEQAMGTEISLRSDLYSLGAMLYEMVCGRPPFIGDESVAIITQHLNTPPIAPSWHRPDCPSGLELLILSLLEKDSEKRPSSAAELRETLEAGRRSLSRPQGEGPGVDAQQLTATDNPLYRRTFVGRESELKQLQTAFDGALAGQGALVMVVGEPGIGKTSLCEQLVTYAAIRGGKALVGHCYEEGSISLPYLPFVEAIRSYVLSAPSDKLRQEIGSGATELARIVSEVRDKLDVEPRPPGDPEDDRWRLYQAVTGFLKNASSVQPLVLILEDLHDADRGTIDYLIHVSRNLAGARLLVVGTYRDVEVDRTHPLSGALAELRRGAAFGRVPLRGLTVDEVHRMMSLVRGQEVPWSRAEAIHRQTEGNPLFVQEVLRYLVEEGLVVREGGRYIPKYGEDPEAGIPEGLRDVIGKRLSRLSEKTNQLLSIAAVIGREFRLDVLQRVGSSVADETIDALEEATERAVIEVRSALGANIAYRFTHAFFRQTLYEEISPPRRIRWHQEVARVLEQVHGRRLEEHAAELADHFAHSSDSGDLHKAVTYGETAARKATSMCAYGEAAEHLERALEVQDVLDPDDSPKQCDLLLALADALMAGGEPQRAVEGPSEAAFRLAETLADGPRACHACRIALAGMNRYGGGTVYLTSLWGEWVNRADRWAPPDNSDRVFADVAAAVRLGPSPESYVRTGRALELARALGDPEALYYAAQERLRLPETEDQRLSLAEELTDWPRHGVSTYTLSRSLYFAGAALLSAGRREKAEDLWRELVDLATRTRDTYALLRPPFLDAIRATLDGRLEDAVVAADRLATLGEELGSSVFAHYWAAMLASRPLLHLGRATEAITRLQVASQDPGGPGQLRERMLSVALGYAGRYEEAKAILLQLPAGVAERVPEARVRALELAHLLNDRELVADFLPGVDSFAGTLGNAERGVTSVARHVGAAYALLGEPEKARGYYHQAIDICTRARFRPELALTHLQLAELLLADYPKERDEALEYLDFAISEFTEMKMQPSLERALRHKGLLHA